MDLIFIRIYGNPYSTRTVLRVVAVTGCASVPSFSQFLVVRFRSITEIYSYFGIVHLPVMSSSTSTRTVFAPGIRTVAIPYSNKAVIKPYRTVIVRYSYEYRSPDDLT